MSTKGNTDPQGVVEEGRLLDDAKKAVKVSAFQMERALDANKLVDALKHASTMLSELRTGALSPANYYDLYNFTCQFLQELHHYLVADKHGKSINELYELVQYVGNIIPRLYLLVTVGSAYIQMKKAPAKEVLKDLVEMLRGVQHPTRGLFLRFYLYEMTKNKLPTHQSEYADPKIAGGGNLLDAIDFVLVNFTEMNKLWVRMQHQGSVRDKSRREKERRQIATVVGRNLQVLASMDGLDEKVYKEKVLPAILKQFVLSKDTISQEHLLDFFIQGISADFHLKTLKPLLRTIGKLQPDVDVKQIMVSFIERMTVYIAGEDVKSDVFPNFFDNVKAMVEKRPDLVTEDVIAMCNALVDMALKCYRAKPEYVDQILSFANERCTATISGRPLIEQVIKLLRIPLEAYKNILNVIPLANYPLLLAKLGTDQQKRIANDIVKNVGDHQTYVKTIEQAQVLLGYVSVLVGDGKKEEDLDQEDLASEQNQLTKLFHVFRAVDIEQQLGMLKLVKDKVLAAEKARLKYTGPGLVFAFLRFASFIHHSKDEVEEWEKKVAVVIKQAFVVVQHMADAKVCPEVSVALALKCATQAAICGISSFAYDTFTTAIAIFEEDITQSKVKYEMVRLFIGTLRILFPVLDEESYQTLAKRITQESRRLVQRTDQCRALIACSHLCWITEGAQQNRDSRVYDFLMMANKIACDIMETNAAKAVEIDILNEYIYYLEHDAEPKVQEFNTLYSQVKASELDEACTQQLQQLTKHISLKKTKGDTRFADIIVQ